MMMMMMMIRWWDHDDVSWSSVGEYLIWWPSHKNWMNRADAQSNLFNFVVYCHCCIILYTAACFMWCRIYKCCCILPQELKEPTWCPELCFFKFILYFFAHVHVLSCIFMCCIFTCVRALAFHFMNWSQIKAQYTPRTLLFEIWLNKVGSEKNCQNC